MKRVLFKVMLTFFAAGLIFAVEPNPESEFEYDLASVGEAIKITKYIGKSTTVVIPDTIEGYPVTEIDSSTFDEKKNGLVSVTIPASIKEIPNGNGKIEFYSDTSNGLFQNAECEVIFNDIKNIETIGNYAFRNFKGKITFADGTPLTAESLSNVTYFGKNCFENYKALTGKFVLSSNMHFIGENAFSGTEITEVVFDGFEYNHVIVGDGRVEYTLGKGVFQGCKSLKSVLVLKNAVLTDESFKNCISLKNIEFADSITIRIGNYCFSGCTALTGKFVLSSNIEAIGSSSFEGTSITEIVFDGFAGENKYDNAICSENFYGCKSLESVSILKDSTLWGNEFANFTSLKKIEFADNITIRLVGKDIFKGCTNLTDVIIPETTKFTLNYHYIYFPKLQEDQFSDCPNLSIKSKLAIKNAKHDE